ncbi:MAG: DUF805 domain-containing protein [Pseudomonadota bacterium]
MGLIRAISKTARGWNDFETRASRSEYWWGVLTVLVLVFCVQSAVLALFAITHGPTFNATGTLTEANPGILLALNLSIALICFFLLPLTARRFKDHGWQGSWFSWMRWPAYALLIVSVVAIGLSFLGNIETATSLSFVGFALAFPPYASVIWCFWIGFVRPEPGLNAFGPNPSEV